MVDMRLPVFALRVVCLFSPIFKFQILPSLPLCPLCGGESRRMGRSHSFTPNNGFMGIGEKWRCDVNNWIEKYGRTSHTRKNKKMQCSAGIAIMTRLASQRSRSGLSWTHKKIGVQAAWKELDQLIHEKSVQLSIMTLELPEPPSSILQFQSTDYFLKKSNQGQSHSNEQTQDYFHPHQSFEEARNSNYLGEDDHFIGIYFPAFELFEWKRCGHAVNRVGGRGQGFIFRVVVFGSRSKLFKFQQNANRPSDHKLVATFFHIIPQNDLNAVSLRPISRFSTLILIPGERIENMKQNINNHSETKEKSKSWVALGDSMVSNQKSFDLSSAGALREAVSVKCADLRMTLRQKTLRHLEMRGGSVVAFSGAEWQVFMRG